MQRGSLGSPSQWVSHWPLELSWNRDAVGKMSQVILRKHFPFPQEVSSEKAWDTCLHRVYQHTWGSGYPKGQPIYIIPCSVDYFCFHRPRPFSCSFPAGMYGLTHPPISSPPPRSLSRSLKALLAPTTPRVPKNHLPCINLTPFLACDSHTPCSI